MTQKIKAHRAKHHHKEYNSSTEQPIEETTSTSEPQPALELEESETAPASRPQFKVEEIATEAETESQLDPEAFPPTQGIEEATPEEEQLTEKEEVGMDQFEPTYQQQVPEESQVPSRQDWRWQRREPRQFPIWIVGVGIVLLLIIVGVWRLRASKGNQPQSTPKANEILVETSTASSSPSPEPEEELDRKDFKVQVLNGSGITGTAGKLAKVLEDAGFENVAAGNADNFNTKGILIRVKDGQDKLAELIEQDLEDDYDSIKVKEDLDKDSQYDAVVIRGSQPGDKEEDKVLGEKDEVSQPSDKTSTSSADTEE